MKKQKVLKSFVERAERPRSAAGGRPEHRVYQERILRVECSIKPRRDLIKCDFNRVLLTEQAEVRELTGEQIAANYVEAHFFKYPHKS